MKNLFKVPVTTSGYTYGILLLRLVAGVWLMIHGWKKINDPFSWMGEDNATPAILQALAALSEFGGGLCLILGLITPLATFGIICTMVGAALKHILSGKGSYELALLYLCIALLLFLAGPGRLSADRYIFGPRG